MKVVRCLGRGLSNAQILEEVSEIFKKGNKVAITLKENEVIDFTKCVVGADYESLEEVLVGISSNEIREGFKVEKGEIFGIANTRMVFDNYCGIGCDSFLEAKPFLRKGCEDAIVVMSFEGYDDGIIAIEEVCVE